VKKSSGWLAIIAVGQMEQPDMPQDQGMAERARALSHALVGWPSVTGTKDEADFARHLADLLAEIPYFQENPDDLLIQPIEGDPLGRANVMALVRGSGFRTVVLTGHFDVVPVDDYTDLKTLAGDPAPLAEALIARLKTTGGYAQALADLESGAFVPGRGMLDMKSGLAAGISVLEAFAARDAREGNLLFIAVSDEEERSAGARSVAQFLPGFLRERGLDVPLAINLDATCDTADGKDGRVVTMGTIGKLLVSAYVVGKDSHACYPFDGVNAAYLAAEIATEFECSPELAEVTDGELAAPPTVLAAKDSKTVYNVTTPGRAWLFWNVLVHRRAPRDVFETARKLAQRAVRRAQLRIAERAKRIAHPLSATPVWNAIPVLTHAELLAHAERNDPTFLAAYKARAGEIAAMDELDLPARSLLLNEFLWDRAGIDGSAVIIGNASMPYPAVTWQDTPSNDRTRSRIEAAIDAISAREAISIETRAFFPAISDMSFLGPVDLAGLADVAANTPLWGSSIRWDVASAAAGIPIVNIGPWGRDYHHWLERTHADYTFRVLPDLVQAVADAVLAGDPPPAG
jgi:arginine utilization protein RocB